MLRGNPLDRQRDDLLSLALGISLCRVADLADAIRRVRLSLFFHPADQFGLRLLRRHARHLLPPATLLANQLVELLFTFGDLLFTPAKITRAFAEVLVTLVDQLVFAVERTLALREPALFLFDFFTPPSNFRFEILA